VKRLPVVFEDGDCIVFNKPPGLPVQGGAGVGASLDSILAENWKPRPLLVHRLDRDTSGLILVARRPEAAARFSRLFAREGPGEIEKYYLAVSRGSPGEGRITEPLDGKRAETCCRALGGDGEFFLLRLRLLTGRTHQIRRHLALRGNPVLGDGKYGDFALNRRLRSERGLKRLLLHAEALLIPGLPELRLPPPDYFRPFLDRMALPPEGGFC
jgi:23S rRNA pseudouridine955/2504/2580 synthase